MASDEQLLRNRVVRLFLNVKDTIEDSKAYVAHHFMSEGYHKMSIYRIIKRFEERGHVNRAVGSGRPAKIMTTQNKVRLKRLVNHRTGISQRSLATKFGCSQAYISKTIKNSKFVV